MTSLSSPSLRLNGLPTDILILILHELLLVDLSALSLTSRFFHALVNEFGWAGYQRKNPRPSMSLLKSRAAWSAMDSVKYDVLADRSWSQNDFVARPLASPWSGKEQPILAISPSRLIVGAGNVIYSYTFGLSTNGEAPPIVMEGSCALITLHDRRSCITALTFIPDGGLDQTLCVGFQDGSFERILISSRSKHQTNTTLHVHRQAAHPLRLPDKDFLESLSSSRTSLLSLSGSGQATFSDIETPTLTSTIVLGVRSWASRLCMESTSPYAAFGTSLRATPLTIHSITSDALSQFPSAILGQAQPGRRGSAYQDGTMEQSLSTISALPLGVAPPTTGYRPLLRPVLTLDNSWSMEPIYSVSSGGGSGSYVAAGWARHSLVSMWDVRSPIGGLSVHAPLNDPSPVYSLILESSRLFGVTQSRPFVLDFGPGVLESTYPALEPSTRGFPGVTAENTIFRGSTQKGVDDIGYYVTKFLHPSSRTKVRA
ncbi:F-box domain-containing protein [Mycena sanguinolenta]|uniref:F-box domain-containing protein n=1 Tax=Mycena sanguinolenta TaxID=230812 RepID=A0A8H6XR52_9AGAR|nr:F-box domain-containing protein [Mycena sanguinolenta]